MNTYNTSTFVKNDTVDNAHTLSLADKIVMTGIVNVESMREECVVVKLRDGGVCTILGKGLFAEKLDTKVGEIILSGKADCIKYGGQSSGKRELMKKMFK